MRKLSSSANWRKAIEAYVQEVSAPAVMATVTHPYGIVSSFTPQIAWIGPMHNGYQVVIEMDNDDGWKWDSGELTGSALSLASSPLPPESAYRVRVRLKNSKGWGSWSAPQEFSTPGSPLVSFSFPADVLALNDVRPMLRWETCSTEQISKQQIRIDSGAWVSIPADAREYRVARLETGLHTADIRVTETSGGSAEHTVRFYVNATPAYEGTVFLFDLSFLKEYSHVVPAEVKLYYDKCHLLGTLQGLVNRKGPRLFYRFFDTDDFWLDELRDEDNGWLRNAEFQTIADLETLIATFRDDFDGVVQYDPNVWSTSNVASTVAGVEDLVAIRRDTTPGSLYDQLVVNGPKLPIKRSLVDMFTGSGTIPGTDRPSTGSAKCDAHIWAKIHYLDTGRCNPRKLACWVDSYWLEKPYGIDPPEHLLFNHDYIVANKGFIFDLSSWGDETPIDDPDQPLGTDLETKKEILLSAYRAAGGKMIHVAGFTPWWLKYTTRGGGRHEPVPTEWEWAKIASAYNAFLDADATGISDMTNASLFSQFPLPDRLVQNPKPTPHDMRRLGYMDEAGNIAPFNFVYFYIGDYDSAAWIKRRMPVHWNDENRSHVPMGWAFNPNLIDRHALAFDYFYRTKSEQDFFIAGDSGAGYINPRNLLPPRNPSGLPSGAAEWIEHCEPYYRRLDYSITGFLLNGVCGHLTPEVELMFRSFSSDGIMTQKAWMHTHDHLEENMPVATQYGDLGGHPGLMADRVSSFGVQGSPHFLSFRTILFSPSRIQELTERIHALYPDMGFVPLEPHAYFYLLRHSLGGKNEQRATYTFDTIPDPAPAGKRIEVQVGVRNDGWETWRASGPNRTVLAVSLSPNEERDKALLVPLPWDIAPGEGEVLSFELQIPAAGRHKLMYQMRTGDSGWFEDSGHLPWRSEIVAE